MYPIDVYVMSQKTEMKVNWNHSSQTNFLYQLKYHKVVVGEGFKESWCVCPSLNSTISLTLRCTHILYEDGGGALQGWSPHSHHCKTKKRK